MTDFLEKYHGSDLEERQEKEQAVQDVAFTTYSGMLPIHFQPSYFFSKLIIGRSTFRGY